MTKSENFEILLSASWVWDPLPTDEDVVKWFEKKKLSPVSCGQVTLHNVRTNQGV